MVLVLVVLLIPLFGEVLVVLEALLIPSSTGGTGSTTSTSSTSSISSTTASTKLDYYH